MMTTANNGYDTRQTAPKNRGGRPPKHGARALERHLRNQSLDGRTRSAKLLAEIGDALAADRGGWGNVTAAERLLIENIAAEAIILRSLSAWVLRQPEIVVDDGNGPRLIGPLQKGYTSHLSALTRALSALGIRPDKVEHITALNDYLAQHETNGNGAAAENDGTADATDEGQVEASIDAVAPASTEASALGDPSTAELPAGGKLDDSESVTATVQQRTVTVTQGES